MNFKYRNERNARFLSSFYNIPLDKKDYFRIENSTDESSEILIYGYIGWPFNDSSDFARAIGAMNQRDILVRINSVGGDVWDAHAAHNIIKSHPCKPKTRIESIAASAASYMAIAGKERQAYKNTMMMIHEPMTGLFGNQHEMREIADILAQVNETMVDMYVDNSNLGKKEIREMLKAETWMNAKAAKEKGFIDTIIEAGKPVKASFDLSIFANLPDELKSECEKPKLTEREIEKLLRDGGVSNKRAKAILAGCKNIDGDREEKDRDVPNKDQSDIISRIQNLTNTLKGQ